MSSGSQLPRDIHIVHVTYALGVGGLEEVLINLVNALPEFRHTIISMKERLGWRDRLGASVRVVALGTREGRNLGLPFRLAWLFRQLGPDVVHSRNWGGFDAIPAATLAGVRVVIHDEHGKEVLDSCSTRRRHNLIRRMLHPCVSRFVVVSEDLRQWLVDAVGIPGGKVVTICNGVDTERFRPGDREVERARLGLDPGTLVVGSVGRLDPVKNYSLLLKAVSACAKGRRNTVVLLVGDGPLRSALAEEARELGLEGQLWLLGERKDVPAILRALDVFVLPSISEGMSISLLEAMATGVPVVATRVGGNPELVLDGITGTLVPPGDAEALALAIRRYLDDRDVASQHGKAARARARECFSLERMVDAYRGLYRSCLGFASGKERVGAGRC